MSNVLDDLITDIIARIEAGVPPWRQAWKAGGDPTLPLRADGEPFNGSNAWLLSFAGAVRGYRSPYWFTFRQALAINAPVAKGEKGSPAILYKTRVVGDAGEGEASGADEGADAKVLRYLKTYTVFNAEQLTDCPARYIEVAKPDPAARSAARNAVLDAIPARIEFGGGQPCYVPARDLIRLPRPEVFETVDDFLATKAHEQLHWSGAPHRLAREFGRRFGDEAYAFEELVAEIGAAALGLRIGLAPQLLDSHAAYLAHWAKILKHRPSALLEASGHAQRAVDYLTFLWRAAGDCMTPTIADGDYLVCDRSLVPVAGDVVVAVVDGEPTVKRFRLSRGRPQLSHDNPKAEPFAPSASTEISVWGVVAWSLRAHRPTR